MTRQTGSTVAKERPRSTATLLFGIGTGAIIALFLFMRLWRLTDVSLDGDEIFSLLLVRSDWHGLFAGVVHDAIHPPFFYVLLKVWVWLGGESLFWLRFFPVVASTLCLVPIFLLCRDLGISRGARNLAVFIASVHPYAIYFAQHMRMYCLLALFGLTSIWSFERYLKDGSRRNLAILSVINLLLVYSHYYGWLIIGLEFLYLLWRKRDALLPFIVAIAAVAALFAPWAWFAMQSLHAKGGLAENLSWVPRPELNDLSWFYVELCGLGKPLQDGLKITVGVLLFIYLMHRRRKEPGFHWLIVVSLAPALVTYLVSQWLSQSIWGSRHLIFTLWPFLLVLADTVWNLHVSLRGLALILILVWAGFAFKTYSPEQQKLHWDRLALAMLDA
ncbi:MAG TPA: glycosyltransferase family 39 protein, partial [Verrucomicrobiae bacterium]|nr:glycosyltransferase family 39 protein [Verrucomicrobiae bacterium]